MKIKNKAAQLLCSLCLISGLMNPSGFAAQAVVPPRLENTEGPGINQVFNDPFHSEYQTMVPTSFFPSVERGQGIEISEVAFRVNSSSLGAFGNLDRVRLSASSTKSTSFTTNPQQNHGTDYTVIFDGSLRVEIPAPTQSPATFDLRIPLEQPYTYYPENGSFIFHIEKLTDRTIGTTIDADKTEGGSLLYGVIGGHREVFTVHNLLMQITYTVVPEPSVIALMGLGIGGLLLIGMRGGPMRPR